MNPVDATIVRLGVYIGQLESQVQELHRQLVDALGRLEKASPPGEPFDTEVEFRKRMAEDHSANQEGYNANDAH